MSNFLETDLTSNSNSSIDMVIAAGAKKKAKGNGGDGPYIGMAARGKWADGRSKNHETINFIKLQISC